ncbi:S41 family peptidase [uncultured Cytophaga sp.]|uniref:S41 family peptidase n=1 Tax=uncultured Cytophaga sp. TaxID=160238 RepID=UPI0026189F2F|nr:S41 family peptidase [uncultured Cytophaga sp.]
MKIKRWGIVTATGIAFIASLSAFTQTDKYFEIAKNMEIFSSVYKEVNLLYVDEINPSQFMETGIDAMLASLDPYTNYIPEDKIEDFRTQLTGQYGGIGAVIGERHDKIMILMPYDGFPAQKAGLQIGDEIISVDGIITTSKNSGEVSKLLRGQADTPLKIKVKRYNQEQPLEFTLSRQKIKISNVPYYGMVNSNTGYMKLSEFTQAASLEVKKALTELKAQGAKQIIFDLRGNPGGLLNEAVNISNIFIPKDKLVVSTKGKVSEWNTKYITELMPDDLDIPLAVLVNGRSASASEIVSGVIQDYDRGVIVGQRSYGKGLVQTTRELPYKSQIKVTTAKYYTPSGRCIQAIDYAHRAADGSVPKFLDSLRTAFQTTNKRTVYDGGGVTPDITVTQDSISPILISLVTKSLLFDYATEYHAKRASIGDARIFKLTDAEYQDFVNWLKGKDYSYVTKVEKSLDEMTAQSKQEKYFDAMKGQLEQMKAVINKDKENDLIKFKPQIMEYLEEEIASRYYLQRGIIEASFDNDNDIQAALEVLNNKTKYDKILSGK